MKDYREGERPSRRVLQVAPLANSLTLDLRPAPPTWRQEENTRGFSPPAKGKRARGKNDRFIKYPTESRGVVKKISNESIDCGVVYFLCIKYAHCTGEVFINKYDFQLTFLWCHNDSPILICVLNVRFSKIIHIHHCDVSGWVCSLLQSPSLAFLQS